MKTFTVLFLCTGNSARSIMAEAILNSTGGGAFKAVSAGSHPTGKVNSHALNLLQAKGLATPGLRSKSWDEFADAKFDLVITVCDQAASEPCPIFPGAPLKAHWGVPDPAALAKNDEEKAKAFEAAFDVLSRRIARLRDLPLAALDKGALRAALEDIGKVD